MKKKVILPLLTALVMITLAACTAQQASTVPSASPTAETSLSHPPAETVPTPPPAVPSPSVSVIPLLTAADIDNAAETLDINGKTIGDLGFFSDCVRLKSLTFSNCVIDAGIKLPHIDSLRELRVVQCGKVTLAFFTNNTQLTSLSLCYAQAEDAAALKDFKHLTRLGLIGNDISDLTALSGLKDLNWLDLLDGNLGITSLKPLYGLKKLDYISLNYGAYIEIPRDELEHFGADPDQMFGGGIIEVD